MTRHSTPLFLFCVKFLLSTCVCRDTNTQGVELHQTLEEMRASSDEKYTKSHKKFKFFDADASDDVSRKEFEAGVCLSACVFAVALQSRQRRGRKRSQTCVHLLCVSNSGLKTKSVFIVLLQRAHRWVWYVYAWARACVRLCT